MIPNKDIQWQAFPKDVEAIVKHFAPHQTVMVVKSDKAITEDDPHGVMFGMLYAPSGTSEDIMFTGSKWCSLHDCYHSIHVISKTNERFSDLSDFGLISKDITLEDINEYYVIEYNHVVRNSNNDNNPVYNK